jgi:hypothetical protein
VHHVATARPACTTRAQAASGSAARRTTRPRFPKKRVLRERLATCANTRARRTCAQRAHHEQDDEPGEAGHSEPAAPHVLLVQVRCGGGALACRSGRASLSGRSLRVLGAVRRAAAAGAGVLRPRHGSCGGRRRTRCVCARGASRGATDARAANERGGARRASCRRAAACACACACASHTHAGWRPAAQRREGRRWRCCGRCHTRAELARSQAGPPHSRALMHSCTAHSVGITRAHGAAACTYTTQTPKSYPQRLIPHARARAHTQNAQSKSMIDHPRAAALICANCARLIWAAPGARGRCPAPRSQRP